MLPKNVRQIGVIEGNNRIYIEDYVMTYAKKIKGMAVLLGKQERAEDDNIFFISGLVEVKRDIFGSPAALNNEEWSLIYEDVKKYFIENEIIGWLLVRTDDLLAMDDDIRKTHEENFSGNHKILFLYDKGENEEIFYLSNTMGELKKQSGFYIYYEKNEAMQNYMVEKNPGEKVEDRYKDNAMEKVREIIAEKEPQKNDKKVINLMYGASTLLAAVVLVIGATMLDNYDKMKNMEETLSVISNNLEDNQTADNSDVKVEKIVGNTEQKEEVNILDKNITSNEEKIEQEEITPVKTPAADKPKDSVKEDEKTKDEKETSEKKEETTDKVEETANDAKDKEETDEKAVKPKQEEANDTKSETEEAKETSAKGKATYIVKEGDTLASISLHFYHSYNYVDKIQKLNKIDDSDKILEGQEILLPN